MKYILGLDIGTNSIGWILFDGIEVLGKGVIIFPIGTNVDKNGIESTKNMERRSYRGTSRNHARYKLRRKNLKLLLSKLEMIPDFSQTFQVKKKYQASELYELRTKALDTEIPLKEIGRIFMLLNKHRGFKSNSKTLIETDNNEEGKVNDGINQLASFISKSHSRTIGEYFHKMYQKSADYFDNNNWHNIDEPYDERAENDSGELSIGKNQGIRREGRYVSRTMYEDEFDLIWEKQKEHHKVLTGSKKEYDAIKELPVLEKRTRLKEFKATAYWQIKHQTIFYQRPLKSQKKYIGKCVYEKNKRTAPTSSLLFQEFRIWKQLADLRYNDYVNDIINKPLPTEWKEIIFNYLQTHLKLPIGKSSKNEDLMDVLSISNKKNYDFVLSSTEDDRVLHGNKTLYAIHNVCGEQKINQLREENQLEKLWHILYMAKDDEWLKDILTTTWNFAEDVATRLIEMGLEDGFAAYSSKVLKKILPFMTDGKDEYDALVLANYLKAPDESRDDIQLAKKIKQLTNNELRNPVVEKAVGETIRLVNTLLKEYKVDQNNFTIRIESTRELKKPKKEREAIRRGNLEIEKRREEYARFLNEKKQKGELLFNRNIQKNDPVINKFELWLELGGDKEEVSFKDFEKLVQRNDREKHALWLECNRICPYTGRVISLTKLFSSDVEIEHIIPYSRCLDDSFMNKTLTFHEINKAKGSLTAYEYIKSKGSAEFNNYKIRISVFSKTKQNDRFLREKVDSVFTNAQLTNTSYTAKYIRRKLQEVCSDVQFTNGSATAELRKNDWKLGNLLDKVRYEEETGLDIDKYFRDFNNYKKDFEAYRRKKFNSTDIVKIDWKDLTPDVTAEYELITNNPIYEWWLEIQKFDSFRGAKGKKDRSDHRHHLLDAIIIALCSPGIIQKLSTLNQLREQQGASLYDDRGELTRERIDCPIPYQEIKNTLKDILVYHKPEQKLISSKINRTLKSKLSTDSLRFNSQKTMAPRGSLHKDTFFGKLKKPLNQGIEKSDVYVSRIILNEDNFKDENSLKKVIDKNVREILRLRLIKYAKNGGKPFSEEALNIDPVYMYSLENYPNGLPENPYSKNGNRLPTIKRVRVANKNSRNLVQIIAKDENKTSVNENRYVETDGNYIMALYESREINKKGKVKIKRDFEILSFYKAVEKRRIGEKLFQDEKEQKDGSFLQLMKSCPSLKAGDFVIIYEESEDEINWDENESLKKMLYKVTELGLDYRSEEEQYGTLKFVKSNLMKSSKDSYSKDGPYLKKLHTGLKAVKVKISRLGRVTKH